MFNDSNYLFEFLTTVIDNFLEESLEVEVVCQKHDKELSDTVSHTDPDRNLLFLLSVIDLLKKDVEDKYYKELEKDYDNFARETIGTGNRLIV